MSDQDQKLLQLDDNKLMDVVKNYRQYGYDEKLRERAIEILEERGISKEDLKLGGNFDNLKYEQARILFASFGKNSRNAFVFYLLFFLISIRNSEAELGGILSLFFALTWIVSLILYFVFLIRSFLNQSRFYKLSGKEYGSEGILLYFILGMPFYMIMYFYFKKQMKTQLKLIV